MSHDILKWKILVSPRTFHAWRIVTRNSTCKSPRSIGVPNIPVTLGRRGNPAVIHRRSTKERISPFLSLSYAILWCNRRRRKRNCCPMCHSLSRGTRTYFTCRNSVTDYSWTVWRVSIHHPKLFFDGRPVSCQIIDIGRSYFNGYKIDFLFNFYHALTVARYTSSFINFSKERKECLIQVKANSTLINFFCICLCYCCRVERDVRYLYTTENRFSRRRSVNALIEVNPWVDALS